MKVRRFKKPLLRIPMSCGKKNRRYILPLVTQRFSLIFDYKVRSMRKIYVLIVLLVSIKTQSQVLSVREQATVVNELLADRLNILLPALMEKTGIDMWVVVSREYNEDPIIKTMLPAEWLYARRRTILVFYNNPGKKVYEKLAIARYNVGTEIKAAWNMQQFPNQWDALADIISTRKPNKIGLNTSADFAHADGLDHTEYTELMQKLPAAFKSKVVSAQSLAVGWMETRTEREMQIYPQTGECHP